MIEIFESEEFPNRILCVTHNFKYTLLFDNVAKLTDKKAPSIRIEGWVYQLLFGLTSVFDFLRIPFLVSKYFVVSKPAGLRNSLSGSKRVYASKLKKAIHKK